MSLGANGIISTSVKDNWVSVLTSSNFKLIFRKWLSSHCRVLSSDIEGVIQQQMGYIFRFSKFLGMLNLAPSIGRCLVQSKQNLFQHMHGLSSSYFYLSHNASVKQLLTLHPYSSHFWALQGFKQKSLLSISFPFTFIPLPLLLSSLIIWHITTVHYLQIYCCVAYSLTAICQSL